MVYKLTVKLDNSYRDKLETLFDYFKVNSRKELIEKIIDFFFERDRQERLDRLELRIEELANRIAELELRLKSEETEEFEE